MIIIIVTIILIGSDSPRVASSDINADVLIYLCALQFVYYPSIYRQEIHPGREWQTRINISPEDVIAGLGFEPCTPWIESQVNEPLYHDTSTN